MLSYWDHGATSDSELMNSAGIMSAADAHHAMPEVPATGGGGGGHHRYASVASLPSGIAGGSYTGAEHYHPYRAASMSMAGPGYHSAHHMGSGSMPYPSVSAPLSASPGFVYGASSSSSSMSYDTSYSQPPSSSSSYSPYVSYLPPSTSHDSRFYPLNPFEIKHRRRTTKTQFRVLESTFREIPKPNATLRKQISAQLDMPVRAVQIWFQNRRAKAKALEKKKGSAPTAGASGGGGGGGGSGGGGGGGGDESNRTAASGVVASSAGGHHTYPEGRYSTNATSQPYDRASTRLMDLPPIRMGEEFVPTTTAAPTLPSIDSSTSHRDRRQLPPPLLPSTLSSGMSLPSTTQAEANSTDSAHSTLSGALTDRSRLPAYPTRDSSRYDHSTQQPGRFWPSQP